MKKVRVKQDRECSYCGIKITAGSESYTYSIKYKGRHWICLKCYRLNKIVQSTKVQRAFISFDDEGAAYALDDYLSEVEEAFECRKGKYSNKR